MYERTPLTFVPEEGQRRGGTKEVLKIRVGRETGSLPVSRDLRPSDTLTLTFLRSRSSGGSSERTIVVSLLEVLGPSRSLPSSITVLSRDSSSFLVV